MLVVDKYYQVVEKDVGKVSSIWRALHILVFLTAAIANLATAIFFIQVTEAFGKNCILYAELHFTGQEQHKTHYNNIGNFTLNETFHNAITRYGQHGFCNFTFLANLACSILAMICLLSIIIVSKGTKSWNTAEVSKTSKSFKLVLPGAVTSGLVAIIVTITAVNISKGIKQFCLEFQQVDANSYCDGNFNNYTLIFNKKIIPASEYIYALLRFEFIALCAWIVQFLSLMFRMLRGPDFKIIVYTLTEVEKEAEMKDVVVASSDEFKPISEDIEN